MSEDLEELLALSDRLAVIHQGRIMGITEDPRALDEEELGLLMAGTPLEEVLQGRRKRGDPPLPGRFAIRDVFRRRRCSTEKSLRAEGEEGRTPWA